MAKYGDTYGTWVYFVPTRWLKLTNVVNDEYKVDRVTFIGVEKLAPVRKRLGLLTPISALEKRIPGHVD